MELDKSFEPSAIEARWYPFWESRGLFKPSMKSGAPAFCIQLPTPNVTGTLHMGHAFQHTLMDVLIRYHRMLGDNTLWQVGTDHAGIATQIVVENQLKAEGMSRRELGRDRFVERVWRWKACPTRCSKLSCAFTTMVSFIAASGSSTGTRCWVPRCPISKSRRRKRKARCGRFATR